MDQCAIDECDRPRYKRGWCSRHYRRWYIYGDPTHARPQYQSCQASGCHREPRTKHADLCEMHYYRMRRNGTLEPIKPQRAQRGACVVDGCAKRDAGPHGYCQMHYTRVQRHGDPDLVKQPVRYAGPDHGSWVGGAIGYGGMHDRLRRILGPASQQCCVDCAAKAEHWSYNHTDPDEQQSPNGPYGTSDQHYSPRCAPCHKTFDQARRTAA